MAETNGWIKLHRKILTSSTYKNLTATQRDVLIQCLLLANHEFQQWRWGKRTFICEHGQFITSLKKLCERCARGTTIQNIRTALKKLESTNFLTNKSTKVGRLITIIKWDTYQYYINSANKDITHKLTPNNNKKNKDIYMCDFNEFWKTYPARNGKKLERGEVLKRFQKLKKDEIPLILKAVNNYANNPDIKNGIGIRDPKRFFKNNFWREWIDAGTKPRRFDEVGH